MNSTTPDRCGIMNRVGRLVRDVPDGVDVQPVHRAEPLRGDLVGVGQELAAGVVDQHVEAPVALAHRVEHRVDLLGLAHVALEREALAARRLDRRARLGERLRAAAADRDRRARCRQRVDDRPADAGAAAGHQRDRAGVGVRDQVALHRAGRRRLELGALDEPRRCTPR